jgi:hypothetical protein
VDLRRRVRAGLNKREARNAAENRIDFKRLICFEIDRAKAGEPTRWKGT